jgi:NADH-dependent peroxiredoxin subunit F
MYELIIIGGGPAGMTAAVYAARKKMNALMVYKVMGGQVVSTGGIENYMGYQYVDGLELMEKFENQLKQFPLDRRPDTEIRRIERSGRGFLVIGGDVTMEAEAVIIATGKKPRQLGVPGEKELLGRGVTYCAVCDGPLFAGQEVLVVGGGNSALEALTDMLRIAGRVHSVSELGFTGDAVLIDKVKYDAKISIYPEHKIIEIQGKDLVEGVIIQSTRTGTKQVIPANGVLVEIGLTPNSLPVAHLGILNSQQEIEVNCRCETAIPGLFAAGDVTSTPEKQIIIAAGEGAKATLQAHKYLQRKGG